MANPDAIENCLCPYCGYDLKIMPQRKKRCPSCAQSIYSKSTPENRTKRLMTEKEALEAEELWRSYNVRQVSISSVLYPFGYDERDIEKERARGAKNDEEAITSLMNHVIVTEKNLQTLKLAYLALADQAARMKKDTFRRFLMAAHHCELLRYGEYGVITKVQIAASGQKDLCPDCQSHRDQILDIKEALKTMPLPCRKCTCTRFDGIVGFCGCYYQPYNENWL